MSGLDKEVKFIVSKLIASIVPEGMSAKERQSLAQKAGISAETLRKNIRRRSLNADTLIRLLIARGVTSQTLANLPQLDLSKLSKGESEWIQLGHELTEAEKLEFNSLIRYLRSRWSLEK